jgi:hypothetical protein
VTSFFSAQLALADTEWMTIKGIQCRPSCLNFPFSIQMNYTGTFIGNIHYSTWNLSYNSIPDSQPLLHFDDRNIWPSLVCPDKASKYIKDNSLSLSKSLVRYVFRTTRRHVGYKHRINPTGNPPHQRLAHPLAQPEPPTHFSLMISSASTLGRWQDPSFSVAS